MKRAHLTGNRTDGDLIDAAKAEFETTNGYKAIGGERQHVPGLRYVDHADTWVATPGRYWGR